MEYRFFGTTGIKVSPLCFGAMTFGGRDWWGDIGRTQQDEADRLIGKALQAGINFFDTANVYSEGESERILGKALGSKRKDVVLATKVRGRMGPGTNDVGLSRLHIMRQVEDSLKRLNTDYIDLYQIHAVDEHTPIEETLRALDDLVRTGKIRYIGCSNMMAWQIMKAIGLSEREGWARFQSVQAYYSIAGRDIEREIVPLLTECRLGLMVWSPLAGGYLSGKFTDAAAPAGARRSTFDFPPLDIARADACVRVIKDIAEARGVSVARIALAWLLHQKEVSSIIIGAKNERQLDDNLACVEISLSAEELRRLDEVSALPREYPGWMLARMRENR
ncbi:MAG TPA: aldo/keto reductase [Dongiaceae bacterium]|jgi:aryl-alcohol dehydrogenase-like predicted oxidoreductase|nr:aldo/keto reductase [Dongiaceae bacterium]